MRNAYTELRELVSIQDWIRDFRPDPAPVTGWAIQVTDGQMKGSIYPILGVKWFRGHLNSVGIEATCKSGVLKNGNARTKTFRVKEYSGQALKVIEYTGEPVVVKKEIKHYDMFNNQIQVGDWMFTEHGLKQVTSTSQTGITFDNESSELRRAWGLYAVVNDQLLDNAAEKIGE